MYGQLNFGLGESNHKSFEKARDIGQILGDTVCEKLDGSQRVKNLGLMRELRLVWNNWKLVIDVWGLGVWYCENW